MRQHTLNSTYSFSGKGLHTGRPVTMQLLPAPADFGIVFQRTDLGSDVQVRASIENVIQTRRCTTLSERGVKIITAEHLLSALSALGVDNALVQIDAAEVPILDGSARPYVEAICTHGLMEQPAERKPIVVERPFVYEDPRSGSRIVFEPADSFSVDVTIDFKSKVIGVQHAHYDETVDYAREIAPCRTFCFRKEVLMLRFFGLIKGGSLDNALVVDEPRGFVGDPVLQFPDEPARHKLLDLLGDLTLAGRPIQGRITAYKPGHKANTQALKQLLATTI
ncbi:MAG: UDP-3-O-[Bacteroidales bacterium]|nr:UDP-3-O-[3-hydroxymyristoyl] N-acetylglucosamine deacetylase [Bacteroidales bacterium]